MDKGKFPYYVVWKGRQPGIYTSWPDCERQVLGFKGCKFKGFYTYGEAMEAWTEFQEKSAELVGVHVGYQGSGHGRCNARSKYVLPEYASFQASSFHSGVNSSTLKSSGKGFDLVSHVHMHEYVINKSMEKWLLRTCYHLQLPCPSYYRHERYSNDAGPYYGFTVVMPTNHLGMDLKATGRYAMDQHHAREDAAFNMLSQLLHGTGMKINDYNCRHVMELQQRVSFLEAKLGKVEEENQALKEEIGELSQLLPDF